MTHDCACGRPIQDTVVICPQCGFQLDAALAWLVAEPLHLAAELDLTLSRQAVMGDRHASRTTTIPAPSHTGAAEAATALHAVLVGWTRIVIEATGAEPPADTIAALATWLRPRVGWLRHHPAAADARDEITDAVRQVRRVVDRPPERLYAGPCDACGGYLYARPGAAYVQCRECLDEDGRPLTYEVPARRRWLLASLDDHLGNARELSRLVGYLGVTVADSTIRWWAGKGRVVAHGRDAQGAPMYRLGDVVRAHYETGRRATA